MKLIYMIAADVLRALGWEVKIKEKDSYWNLVLTNTTSSEDMPESHKSCLRGLLRGWLMEFNYEGGRQQVNIYKELHGLDPEDDRYSCLDTCVKLTNSNTPQYELENKEIFVRRKDHFDRYVLLEPYMVEAASKPADDTPASVSGRVIAEERAQEAYSELKDFVDKIPLYSNGFIYKINHAYIGAHSIEEAIGIFKKEYPTEAVESVILQSKDGALLQNEIPVV